jgi:hypothetical protein
VSAWSVSVCAGVTLFDIAPSGSSGTTKSSFLGDTCRSDVGAQRLGERMVACSGSTGLPKGVLHAHRILHAYRPTLELFYNLALG